MSEAPEFEQLVHKIDPHARLLRTWRLEGGVSAQMTALEIERPDGRIEHMIVRQHGAVDRQRNPHVAEDEFKLLRLLRSVGVPVPAPYYLDRSGQICPTPCIVIEYIDGAPEYTPSNLSDLILQLAGQLARIHTVDVARLDLSFLPQQEYIQAERLHERPVALDETLDEGRIRDRLELVGPLPQRNKPVLLHGDFWPGNILWKDGQLAAIVDWEDAAVGDPLADVANSRLEILWAFGIDAMNLFTQHYRSFVAIDFTDLPYWDLCAALRPASKLAGWGLDANTEKAMREGHRLFVTRALERLSIQ